MKLLIQRVNYAQVTINNNIKSKINKGLLAFLGIGKDDNIVDIDYFIDKLINLRIFEDEKGKFNLSIKDIQGDILVVSQFTLYADCEKGRRPSFSNAMPADDALFFYDIFIRKLKEQYALKKIGGTVATGEFGAMMEVKLENDGPVTVMIG